MVSVYLARIFKAHLYKDVRIFVSDPVFLSISPNLQLCLCIHHLGIEQLKTRKIVLNINDLITTLFDYNQNTYDSAVTQCLCNLKLKKQLRTPV